MFVAFSFLAVFGLMMTAKVATMSLPTVDPGLFVISGVGSCGNGAGYCLLGKDCTANVDFLPDEGGHCDGLKYAFTPRAYFLCCRYKESNRTTTPHYAIFEDTNYTNARIEEITNNLKANAVTTNGTLPLEIISQSEKGANANVKEGSFLDSRSGNSSESSSESYENTVGGEAVSDIMKMYANLEKIGENLSTTTENDETLEKVVTSEEDGQEGSETGNETYKESESDKEYESDKESEGDKEIADKESEGDKDIADKESEGDKDTADKESESDNDVGGDEGTSDETATIVLDTNANETSQESSEEYVDLKPLQDFFFNKQIPEMEENNAIETKNGECVNFSPKKAAKKCANLWKFSTKVMGGEAICKGTLITSVWVLTSAACTIRIFEKGLGNVTVWDSTNEEMKFGISSVIVHENFNPNIKTNNLGLVSLNRPVNYSCYACVEKSYKMIKDRKKCAVNGENFESGLKCQQNRPKEININSNVFFSLPCKTSGSLLRPAGDESWQDGQDNSMRLGDTLWCDGSLAGIAANFYKDSYIFTPVRDFSDWIVKNVLSY